MKIFLIAKYSVLLFVSQFLLGYLSAVYFLGNNNVTDNYLSVYSLVQNLLSMLITLLIFAYFARHNEQKAYLRGFYIVSITSLVAIGGIYSVAGEVMIESLIYDYILSLLAMSAGVSIGIFLANKRRTEQ
ncbi:MAG: hypothetical protein OQJ89_00120 [Kangiellaceae bacterium]|nr:hypothetical protein [Kangiellaceae bacterium]MCW9015343.1 hypothetical protein [Kangiellaceae bacterium]